MAAVAQVNDVARGPFVLIGFRQFKKCLHFLSTIPLNPLHVTMSYKKSSRL